MRQGGLGACAVEALVKDVPWEGRHLAFPRAARRVPATTKMQRTESTPVGVLGKARCLPSQGPSLCQPPSGSPERLLDL